MSSTTSLPLLPLPTGDSFDARLSAPLRAAERITTLQINLGLVCNLACRHCHVESSPQRTGPKENMSAETAERLLDWLQRAPDIKTVDLTGGSPEMNPNFKRIVSRCTELGRQVMDRCNPTILVQRDGSGNSAYDWVPAFLAEHKVHVVASLPCYLEENVRKQRGMHAYDDSVEGLRQLNAAGYGKLPGLRLTLVYNPGGPHLPPPQAALEADYRRELRERFDLEFTELWTITNMPIRRWRDDLDRQGKLADYMQLISGAYNPSTVEGLMCRHQIHVDSQGHLHDCDFNYALGLRSPGQENTFLWEVDPQELAERPIRTADHCYGCTAGSGSSCGGAIA